LLDNFFNPKSIAVVGATPNRNKLGYVVLDLLMRKFKGRLYPVNPKYDELFGIKCYPKVSAIPEVVDLVVVVVPASVVIDVIEDAGKKGVKAAVIISSGFSEIGGEGVERERELVKVAKEYGVRIIGPNCLGVYDAFSGVDTWFIPEERMMRPPPGVIAILSQSGALAAAMLDFAASEGIGIAKAVSYGNRVDVDEADLLEYFKEDPNVKVVLIYVEGFKQNFGRRFRGVAQEFLKEKPIIVLKAGKTARGAAAASSHTGALAGAYKVYRSAFKQIGVIEAENLQELFDMGKALAKQPLPKGRKVAIITDGGGIGVLSTDSLEQLGFEVPETPEEIKRELSKKVPPHVSLRNPIDVAGDTDNERYLIAFEAALRSDEFDAVFGVFLLQPPRLTIELGDELIKLKRRYPEKPLVTVVYGGSKIVQDFKRKLEEGGIPTYTSPERAARALWALAYYSEVKRRLLGS